MRVPYAMGVVCAKVPPYTHISLLPVDSAMYAAPGFSGYAWRNGAGVYRYVESGSPSVAVGDIAVCNGAQISTLTADLAKVIKIRRFECSLRALARPCVSLQANSPTSSRLRRRYFGNDQALAHSYR